MIFLRLSTQNEEAAERVAQVLIEKRYVIDLNVKRNIERWFATDVGVSNKSVVLVTAKTKGLLFNTIDELIKSMFPNEEFEIYSLSISIWIGMRSSIFRVRLLRSRSA